MQADMGSESEVPDNSSATSVGQAPVARREQNLESELDMDAKMNADVPKDEIVATGVHTRKDGFKEIYLKVRAPDGIVKIMKSKDFPDREALCVYWEKHLQFEPEASKAFNSKSETE